MNGIILVDKKEGYTSRDIVNIVSRIYQTKKVGHTGTLDPMATGVLVICVGKATKLVEMLTATTKEYIAEVTLGISTDTLDSTGMVLEERSVMKTADEIDTALLKFVKSYEQEVPKYAAVKVDGKKLYEYARNGIDVLLPKKEVTIHQLERISDVIYRDGKTIFQMKCTVSKGTYIRSLIRDIALTLHTIGTMSALRRTKQGKFGVEECHLISELEQKPNLIPMVDVLDAPIYEVDQPLEDMIRNGRKLKDTFDTEQVLFVTKDQKVLALYGRSEKDSLFVPMKMILES